VNVATAYSFVRWHAVSCSPVQPFLSQRYAEYSSVIKRARLSTSSQIASLSIAAVTSATTRRRSCPFRSTAQNSGVLLVARP
jgi:hypothetical protein